ncbi:MAG: type II secretion system protein [Lachnospiraceae bacterium]|nr:type II secretion system protein [Lachnospiraceae bacterium]
MTKKIKSNNGFTLIELVIALAMLAFIMTAVSALMGSSVLSFRKSKANISVQNSAQATYDKMSDVIMQAKRVVIYGYEISSDVDFEHLKPGDDASGTLTPKYYVSNQATKKELTDSGINEANITVVSSVSKDTKIYVKKMIIDISVPIEEITAVDSSYTEATTGVEVFDALHTGKKVKINKIEDGVYDANDTLRNTFTFDKNSMYYERQYALQTGKNDLMGANPENNLYTNVFNYATLGSDSVTGCIATIDSKNGAIGLNLYFYDKNMRFSTDGMVKLRNSDVLENN